MSYQTDIATVAAMLDMCWAYSRGKEYGEATADNFESVAIKLDRILQSMRSGE
jgi:hypothetical protein